MGGLKKLKIGKIKISKELWVKIGLIKFNLTK